MKITKEPVPDIYTRKVTVEMTEAEWEFITGLARDATPMSGTACAAAARLANGSEPYWEKNLDYSKLFISTSEKASAKYPFGYLSDEEARFAMVGKKLDAIKSYRYRNSCGLKEAKDAVDTYLGLPVY